MGKPELEILSGSCLNLTDRWPFYFHPSLVVPESYLTPTDIFGFDLHECDWQFYKLLDLLEIKPGMKDRKEQTGSQPPRNRMVVIALSKIMLMYSAMKNMPNVMDEYSVLKPPTSSDSPSGKSKGCLFVSARLHVKTIKNSGKNKKIFQQCF